MPQKKCKPKEPCGCSDPKSEAEMKSVPSDPAKEQPGRKKFVRTLATPASPARTRLYDPPQPLSEVVVSSPGFTTTRAVAPTRAVDADFLDRLQKELKDLPTLRPKPGEGGVDVKLEDLDGNQVKEGSLVLDGPNGMMAIPLDPATRRFRAAGMMPGKYQARASSAAFGRAVRAVEIRADDVTRLTLPLDGSSLRGSTKVRFNLNGAAAAAVKVRATLVASGQVVFDQSIQLAGHRLEVSNAALNRH